MLVVNVPPAVEQMAMIEPFGAKKLYVLLRFARWDDVMKLPAPNPQHALLTMLSHFGRGVAQAARGNAADAEREREAYRQAQTRVSPDFDWGYNKARNMFAVSDAVLNAWIARAKRDDTGAIDAWRTRGPHRRRAQLQRAGRLVLPDARVARRGAAAGEGVRASRRGLPPGSHEESGKRAFAVRVVADVAAAEEGIGHGGGKGLQSGLEKRRRAARPGGILTLPFQISEFRFQIDFGNLESQNLKSNLNSEICNLKC
jgi:hypothetical protein